MKVRRIRNFLTSPTGRLAESYLLVMMLVSIGFSLVFYLASTYQLGRQLPPDSYLHQNLGDNYAPPPNNSPQPDNDGDLGDFLHARIDEGIASLRYRLLYLNMGALAVGGVLSFYLARRTLRPIEQALEAQMHFVNDASHELRTPLTAIKAGNDVALRNPKLSLQEARHVIRQNGQDIERLKALSDGLLSLARNDQTGLALDAVDLQDIVGAAMTQVVPQATAKSIAVHDEAAKVDVVGNKAALEQVLVILLDNAVKYSDQRRNIYIRSRQKGKTVYLDVADEGVGIRASDIPHLFRRFYRADQSRHGGDRNGYGLGLSIAERIMTNLGGSIGVVSKPGEGSTFTLKLRSA